MDIDYLSSHLIVITTFDCQLLMYVFCFNQNEYANRFKMLQGQFDCDSELSRQHIDSVVDNELSSALTLDT